MESTPAQGAAPPGEDKVFGTVTFRDHVAVVTRPGHAIYSKEHGWFDTVSLFMEHIRGDAPAAPPASGPTLPVKTIMRLTNEPRPLRKIN